MAQLKDLLVTGPARITGAVTFNQIPKYNTTNVALCSDLNIATTITNPTATIVTDISSNGMGISVTKSTLEDLGLNTVYKYKGTKTWAQLKAIKSAAIGDVYSISDADPEGNTNADWACLAAFSDHTTNETKTDPNYYGNFWSSLGGKVDLSGYVTTSGAAAKLSCGLNFTDASGGYGSITPDRVRALIGDESRIKRGTWYYAGNGYIPYNANSPTAGCPFGAIDLAGTTVLQTRTTDDQYTQLYITPPTHDTTGAIGGEMVYFINNGSSYNPTWYRVLTDKNFNTYAPKKDGTGASGNWGISITGNAATATNIAWSGVTSKPSYYDEKAIKSITRKGTTFTYTCMDGTTGTFTQQDNNTHYTTKLVATSSSGTAHAATINGNTYLRLFDDSTARQSIKITGSGATSVTSDANGVITISSTDTNTHPAVVNNAPTLSWGSTSTVGTIGGTALTVTMPANPNTHVSNSAWHAIELNSNDATKLASYGGFIDFHYRDKNGALQGAADYTSRIIEDAEGELSLNSVRCLAGGTLKFNKLSAPKSSGSAEYSTGSAGQMLRANGSGTIYWDSVYTYGTNDYDPGETPLATGQLYFVYEA